MDKIKKEEENVEKEIPSVRIEKMKITIFQLYKYLEQLEIKGFENSKILNLVFNSFLQMTQVLEELEEDVMNLEGKEVVEK